MEDAKDWNRDEPVNFNVECFLETANELARLDEVERALWVLDNLPAYYRDHTPVAVRNLKNDLIKKIATPSWYSSNDYETNLDDIRIDSAAHTLRAQLILKDVELCNNVNLAPHVVDYGPGEFWLPALLTKKKKTFSYEPVVLHGAALQSSRKFFESALVAPEPSQPRMFIACEIIEHLWQENEIKTEMLRHCDLADVVHVSTPKYSFDVYKRSWRDDTQQLGHLRAYTPKEFINSISQMFPEYYLQFYDSKILHLRLVKKDTVYPHLLNSIKESIITVDDNGVINEA